MTEAGVEPERFLSSRPVFDGKIVGLHVDKVELPGGREALREVVEHKAAVVVVPVDPDGNVLLVRQYRYPVENALLEAPAGVVEEGEEAEECARRELQEETGFAAGTLRSMGGFWTSPGYCTEFMHAYLARDLVPSKLSPDEDERILMERRPLSQARELIRQGEIRDAKTIAALLMAVCVFDDL